MRYVLGVTKGMRGGQLGTGDTYYIVLQGGPKCRAKFGRLVVEQMR